MQTAGLVNRGREVVGHGKKVGYASNKVMMKKKRSNKYCKRRIEERQGLAPMQALQKLFLSCKDVFKGPGTVPTAVEVQKICDILDDMKPEDVGLSRNLRFFKANGVVKGIPRVTYTTIYRCDKFSLCIFFLPAKALIPLHNHPGMTVFSKLLLGTMHIKSYDWVDQADPDSSISTSKMRLAKMKANNAFTAPCRTGVLYPTTGGNIHEFTAITPCAVLDVLGPPYSAKDGRDCSYYKEFPYSACSNGEGRMGEEEGDKFGWLEEIEVPEDSQMDGIEYLGPQIIDV